MSDIHVAVKCFQENLNDFGNPNISPEKHNLYVGLTRMAESLREIEQAVREVQDRLR